LLERMVQVLEMQQKHMDSPAKASRGNMKIPTLVSIPKGDDKALEDLRGWKLEFDRVVRHMNGGSFPPPADQISHLLSSWAATTKAGLAMRNRAREEDYLQKEKTNADQWCYDELWAVLCRKEVPPAQRRRRAEEDWKTLRRGTGEDLSDFDSRFDSIIT